jgi:hypothetical protein
MIQTSNIRLTRWTIADSNGELQPLSCANQRSAEQNGQPGYGSTSTAGKPANLWATDYDLSKVGEILPGIRG